MTMKGLDGLRRLVARETVSPALDSVTVRPIGVVRSRLHDLRYRDTSAQPATIEVLSEYEGALAGLDGFSHIIVVTWLHAVAEEERMTLHERPAGLSELPEIGVFALRTHHRPNPIGLTVVRLERVIGPRVEVIGLDVVD